MHIANWTLTDEERSIIFDVCLRYTVNEGEFIIEVFLPHPSHRLLLLSRPSR